MKASGGVVCSVRDERLESAATMQCMAANAARDATAESSPPSLRETTKPDLLTIAAIAIAATVIADFIHEGDWSWRHVRGHGRAAAGALHCALRVQRGHPFGGGGRDARQSDLRSAVLGGRACSQAGRALALLLGC